MTSPVDIRPDQLEIVQDILLKHLPAGVKVWVFGSRANWTTKDSSDLDLALEGESKLSHKVMGALEDAFEDSSLPYTVDVVDLNRIGDSFRRIVELQRVPLSEDGYGNGHTLLNGWRELPFSEAVQINPMVRLGRGVVYPFVDMAAVNADSRSARSAAEREFKGSGSRFQSGDTLMARITPCLENGKIARYQAIGDEQQAHGSTEFIVIRGRSGVTDNDFAYYLTQWDDVRNYAIGQMTGTSGRQRVPVDCLDHLEIPLPPLPKQRAIAHVLGTLDDKIELNRRMNETLEAMARALFKSWFVDFDPVRAKLEGRWRLGESLPGLPADLYDLFPDHLVDSELGEIPEGWEVRGLGELCSLRSGSVFRKASQGKPSGKYPFIKVGDMNLATNSVGISDANNWIDEADLNQLKAKPFPIDATVFAKIGEGLKQNRIRILLRPTLIDNNMMAAVPNADAIDPLVLFYALSQFDFGEVAGGTALPYLTVRSLNALTVPVPRLEEQIPLAEPLRLMHRRHIANEIESHTLTARRDVLLPKLVSGEVRI